MKKLVFLFSILFTLCLASCGGGGSSSSSSESGSSSDNLSQYAGKWQLYQQGNSPTESATFTLKITSGGNASISHYARTGYSEECLESGDGYAELNGNVLFVEITSGKSRGTTLRLNARNGRLYTADGQEFSKSY